MKVPLEEEEPSANLLPLIDVVFQLLVFFMVATSFRDDEKQLDLELPESVAGAQSTEHREIVVHVRRDGTLRVGASDVGAEGLVAALRAAAEGDPDVPVTIRGDRLAHHEAIVRVMDACEAAGLTRLAVGTSEPRSAEGPP